MKQHAETPTSTMVHGLDGPFALLDEGPSFSTLKVGLTTLRFRLKVGRFLSFSRKSSKLHSPCLCLKWSPTNDRRCLQAEIRPVALSAELESGMLHTPHPPGPSSRPPAQFWTESLDPWKRTTFIHYCLRRAPLDSR